jgi:AcrR family transcriptional regulator
MIFVIFCRDTDDMHDNITPKRLSREQSQAQTRERIIEAGRRLFIQQGYGAASIRDIAEAAGYSQGAFYSNFKDKEAVLLELLRGHMEAEASQLAALCAAAERDGADVLAALDAWAASLNDDANWAVLSVELQLHANRSDAFADAYRAVWEAHRGALARVLARLFDLLGKAPPAAPEELAAGFMALAHGLGLQRATIAAGQNGGMIMLFLRGLLNGAGN